MNKQSGKNWKVKKKKTNQGKEWKLRYDLQKIKTTNSKAATIIIKHKLMPDKTTEIIETRLKKGQKTAGISKSVENTK